MGKATLATIAGMALLGIAVAPANGDAQGKRGGKMERYPPAHITIEVLGGYADYGRFLEQNVLIDDIVDDFVDDFVDGFVGQREVTASGAVALGASVGVYPWEKTGVRLGFTWSPTEIEYRDDSGIDVDILDADDLADLDLFVFNLDVIRFLVDPSHRFAPYAAAGITAAWWALDDDGVTEILATDDTQFRWGGIGSIGVQYLFSRRFGARAEVATMSLGNPFDGDDSFRTATGRTFDEPNSTRVTRIALALTYSFLRK